MQPLEVSGAVRPLYGSLGGHRVNLYLMHIDGRLDSSIVWAPLYRLGPTFLINVTYAEILSPQPPSVPIGR